MEKTLQNPLRASLFGLAAVLTLTWVLCLGVRLVELPNWQIPALQAGDEPLMGTHDAYAWLAGAKGIGSFDGLPLSRLVSGLHAMTSASLGHLGFWLPPLMAALAGLPLVVLARRWGAPAWAPAAGTAGSCAIGFLIRTRVAMLDTDVLSLLGPSLAVVALCLLLGPLLRSGWTKEGADEPGGEPSPALWLGTAGLCLWVRFNVWFYGSIGAVFAPLFGFAILLGLVLARPGRRALAVAFCGLPLAAMHGPIMPALFAPAAACLLFWRVPGIAKKPAVLWGAALAALCYFLVYDGGVLQGILGRVAYWFKPSSGETKALSDVASLSLPSVLPSIREAQNIPFADVLRFLAGHPALFPVFLAGYVWLVVKRPVALVFLPLLLLGLTSLKLGARFSMFAAPAMGAGLIGLGLLAERFIPRRGPRLAAAVVGLLAALLPPAYFLKQVPPIPVLSRPYAETLIGLGGDTRPDAWIWLWWDFGYATQYYADRFPIADGARHTQEWLYPVASVHAAEPARAAGLMRFFAAEMEAQEVTPEQAAHWARDPAFVHTSTPPMKRLLGMDGKEAAALIAGIEAGWAPETPAAYPDQEYVVAWDNMRLAGWIIRFGTWDIRDGSFKEGKVTRLQGDLRVDSGKGVAMSAMAGNLPLISLDVLSEAGAKHASWPRMSGVHLVMNAAAREAYIMDDTAYESSMVQMLVRDPGEFSRDYELVRDNAPWTRVYRLKPRPGQ